jgi:hypothetical protein
MNILRRLFASERDDGFPLHGKIAVPLVICGVALLTPGFRDGALSYLNKKFDLGLTLDVPWWVGLVAIGLGVLAFLVGTFSATSQLAAGRFVAIRHQSFQPLASLLPREALPRKMRQRKIDFFECDQSNFLSGGALDPIGAVRQQQRLASDIAAVRKADPNTAFGYYGIVHIPLQFLAGCSVSTYPEVALFDLDRETSNWRELQGGTAPNLHVKKTRVSDPPNPTSVVVRIEISYPISVADPADIISSPFREYSLAVSKPGIDKITHYKQIEALSVAFREIMDEIHNETPNHLIVHVFYAGPVGLGFSLGRRISKTIHNRTIVYNYNSKSMPTYSWGVDVTSDDLPEKMVVYPSLITKPVD